MELNNIVLQRAHIYYRRRWVNTSSSQCQSTCQWKPPLTNGSRRAWIENLGPNINFLISLSVSISSFILSIILYCSCAKGMYDLSALTNYWQAQLLSIGNRALVKAQNSANQFICWRRVMSVMVTRYSWVANGGGSNWGSVSVVTPALNEAEGLNHFLVSLDEDLSSWQSRVFHWVPRGKVRPSLLPAHWPWTLRPSFLLQAHMFLKIILKPTQEPRMFFSQCNHWTWKMIGFRNDNILHPSR